MLTNIQKRLVDMCEHRSRGFTFDGLWMETCNVLRVCVPKATTNVSTSGTSTFSTKRSSRQTGDLLGNLVSFNACIKYGRTLKGTCWTARQARIFLREELDETRSRNYFSVGLGGTHAFRCIVTHEGDDEGAGKWKCTKDSQGSCVHTKEAKTELQRLLQCDPNATHEETPGELVEARECISCCGNDSRAKWKDWLVSRVRNGGEGEKSISHLPILPPHWAELKTDEALYPRPDPAAPIPPKFLLERTSSCPCKGERTFYDESLPTIERDCKVYSLSGVSTHRIVLQKCRTCPGRQQRFIGPDLREMGVFNLNNRTLMTHELLNEFTSELNSSETPFVAWTKTVSRRYAGRDCRFMSSRAFEGVWFAYIRVQQLGNSMKCTKCGPNPTTVIWDGVTVAFATNQLTTDLHPPTTIHDDAPVRNNTYAVKPQLIQDKSMCLAIRKVMAGPDLATILDESGSESEGQETSTPEAILKKAALKANLKAKTAAAKMAHLSLVHSVSQKLGSIDASLKSLFDREIGARVYESGEKVKIVYRELFNQVSNLVPGKPKSDSCR